jgi:hypothetical protein
MSSTFGVAVLVIGGSSSSAPLSGRSRAAEILRGNMLFLLRCVKAKIVHRTTKMRQLPQFREINQLSDYQMSCNLLR